MLNATGPMLLPEFLPPHLLGKSLAEEPTHPQAEVSDLNTWIDSLVRDGTADLHRLVLGAVERLLLTRVLQHTQGIQSKASELLGINRATLRTKLRALGLAIDKVVTEGEQSEEASTE
jgi:DNA-binding protein Fis